jgi:WD40 repeat protein
VLVFQGESAANDLCFTADGAHLLTARDGGLVDAWELATGARTQLLGARILQEVMSGVPPLVSLCSTGVALRTRIAGPIEFARIDGRIGSANVNGLANLLVAPNGAFLVARATTDETHWFEGYAVSAAAEFRLTRSWVVTREAYHENAVQFLGYPHFLTCTDSQINVRSVINGKIERALPYNSNYIRSFAVSPDATRFASMGWDRLYLFDATTWAKPTVVTGFSVPILSMAYHPTRPVLATVQSRQTLVKYLDANTGKPIKKFAWKLGSMRAVAFSADGALAAASAADGRIVVWDADA